MQNPYRKSIYRGIPYLFSVVWMEEVVKVSSGILGVGPSGGNFILGKPPWSERPHDGKLERMILQIGRGKGRFDEAHGIPRSIGCIGNNRFFLRREKLTEEEIRKVLKDFKSLRGDEVWITNYDSVSELTKAAEAAVDAGIKDVNVVVLREDLEEFQPVEGVKTIVELEYNPNDIIKTSLDPKVDGMLVMIPPEKLEEASAFLSKLDGTGSMEIYGDVLYPKSARFLTFNVIEVRRTMNPTTQAYHDCLSGMIAVSADGYITPCPLLRNFVLGDVRRGDLRRITRKKKLKEFWRMTKDKIEGCSKCPFKYICHDCRALEYQATGEITGMEYCPMFP
jgi:radical SAM protein with 4Fe4S-binding SPASM domain